MSEWDVSVVDGGTARGVPLFVPLSVVVPRALRVPIGDGALGFWSALRDVRPETTVQRDWCHKLVNVLDKLPKR